jgi:hypothetical protein
MLVAVRRQPNPAMLVDAIRPIAVERGTGTERNL